MWNGHRLSRYKKCLSSLNEWQVKGVEYFLHCHPALLFSSALQPLASYHLLSSSAFPVSPFLLILVSSVSGYFSVLICVLRELCGELSLFYTATIKKQGKGF